MGKIEFISSILIAGSSIPYVIRILREHSPSFTSWLLWLINSFAILVTYEQLNGEENIWVVRASVLDTVIVVSTLLMQNKINIDFKDKLEMFCLMATFILIFVSLSIKGNTEINNIAFIVAIVIELLSAYSQMKINFTQPNDEGPFAWIIYAIGYGLSLQLITEPTLQKIILPIFMVILYSIFALPLIMHRITNRMYKLRDWL